jgi:uncharacterized protein YcsI (UPF0317 family)
MLSYRSAEEEAAEEEEVEEEEEDLLSFSFSFSLSFSRPLLSKNFRARVTIGSSSGSASSVY